VKDDQAILAVVGEGMKGRPGVAGKVFESLGRQNINISAIAQGASERNISCVIDASQQVRALNAIHQGFFETKKRLALAMIRRRQRRQRGAAAAAPAALVSAVEGLRRDGGRPGQQQAVRRRRERHRPRRLEGAAARRLDAHGGGHLRAADRGDGADQRRPGGLHRGPDRRRRLSAFIDANLHIITRTSGRTRCRGRATRR
jgi:predicted amino acid-binding ACT domain protein